MALFRTKEVGRALVSMRGRGWFGESDQLLLLLLLPRLETICCFHGGFMVLGAILRGKAGRVSDRPCRVLVLLVGAC